MQLRHHMAPMTATTTAAPRSALTVTTTPHAAQRPQPRHYTQLKDRDHNTTWGNDCTCDKTRGAMTAPATKHAAQQPCPQQNMQRIGCDRDTARGAKTATTTQHAAQRL
jgi:hypothetical protein